MRLIQPIFVFLFAFPCFSQNLQSPIEAFYSHSASIEAENYEAVPVQDRGRIKPLHTFARETVLFLTGAYKFSGLSAVQVYLGLVGFADVQRLKVINVRHSNIRKALGLESSERFFSPNDLDHTGLKELATPLLEKEQANRRSLEPNEKHILEVYNQYWLLKQVHSGEHFLRSVDISSANEQLPHGADSESDLLDSAKKMLQALVENQNARANQLALEVIRLARSQPYPDLIRHQLDHVDLEITYNKLRPFFIAALLFLLLGICLIMSWPKALFARSAFYYLMPLPFIPLAIGFAMRIYITGFAPVTNMYGTMIWVSFGIGIFSSLIWYLYRKNIFVGGLWVAAAVFLCVAESIPLILSPDLDPIVAVLRSNLWLTIHVLTIVISYAALAISMVLGNIVLIRSIYTGVVDDLYVRDAAKTCYRMIQLGVFLLSVGIILGGVWADYSWGRFWGWDPKETWALIADLGFLAILHARYVGWIGAFGLLASSTVGFLLVIMAWYGVNFILASGLHSYGFSSGGAALVLTFVIAQFGILGLALGLIYRRTASRS